MHVALRSTPFCILRDSPSGSLHGCAMCCIALRHWGLCRLASYFHGICRNPGRLKPVESSAAKARFSFSGPQDFLHG